MQPGSFSDPLRCTLSAHDLPEPPPYEALSYTWGENVGHYIDCDGRSLFIRENLYSALRRLRQERTARLLWVDAVCINQSNIAERNQQICLMGSIYQNAVRVLVWLGESSADSAEAFKLLSQINALENSSDAIDLTTPLKAQDLVNKGLPEPPCPSWTALDALYWREWFTRVWIIQEIAMAKEAIVICGKDQDSWKTFEAGAKFILQHSLVGLTDVDPKRTIKLSEFRRSQEGTRNQLLHLLMRARDSYAKDDRDKIYAILSLAPEDNIALKPDYSKSADEIYTLLAVCFIEKNRNFDVLSAIECRKYSLKSKLPTWVPDWEVHPIAWSFVSMANFPSMQASGGSQSVVSFSSDNKVLSATGMVVDTLLHVGEIFWEHVPLSGSAMRGRSRLGEPLSRKYGQRLRDYALRTRWGQWEMIAHKIKQYPTGEDVSTAYIRTLIADNELAADSSPETYLQYYTAWLRYWTALSRENDKPSQSSPPPRSQEDAIRATKFLELHHRAAYGRCFFTSKRGYMGLGPQLSGYGYVIVVLLGGKTPYILRKDGKAHYRFVGECFVHGLMDGEALACDGNMQTFNIR